MGDDNADNQSQDQDVENEDQQDDEQSDSEDTSQQDGADDDGGKDDGTDAKDDDASKDDKKSEDKAKDDGEEPPVRKTAKDYIIERKQRKIEKLQGKKNESGDDDADLGEDNGDDQDDQPDVHKVVAEAVTPITEELHKERREREIDQFFADPANAAFKRDEAKIRRWATHQNRASLPVKSVAYEVSGDRLLAIGASKERQATAKASKTAPAGHAGKDTKAEKPISELSTKEVIARSNEIKKKLADR